MLSRRTAYAIIASIGFIVGVFIYSLAVIIIPWLMQIFTESSTTLGVDRQIIEVVFSGIIGSIVFVLAAYVWATKTI